MNLEYSYAGLTLYAEIHDFAKDALRAQVFLRSMRPCISPQAVTAYNDCTPASLAKGSNHRFLYVQARSNVPNSTPQFEVAGSIEYIDGHDAGFYFIGYSECRVPCKLALIQLNTT